MIANDSKTAMPVKCDFQGRKVVKCRITDADRTDCEVPMPDVLPPNSFIVAILR